MSDVEVEVLYQQSPPHESLVVIKHAGQKNKGIMISEHYNRQRSRPNIDLKVL